MKTTFYPTITTVSGNYFKKLAEVNRLNINKLCVFFTTLDSTQRKEFYQKLEKSFIKEIPFAHIRGDFTKNEIYYLKEKFNTKRFNFHSSKQHQIFFDPEELKKEIFIENTMTKFTNDEINNYAGICIDFSHLENDRLKDKGRYNYFFNLISKMPCACAHASAIKSEDKYCPVAENSRHDKHKYTELKDFDYLLRYKKILPEIVALEVENSIEEQLKAINYINDLLKL